MGTCEVICPACATEISIDEAIRCDLVKDCRLKELERQNKILKDALGMVTRRCPMPECRDCTGCKALAECGKE